MSYAISSVGACQEPSVINPQLTLPQVHALPPWASKLASTENVWYDRRSEFRRTCELEVAEQGGGLRDNCVLYDMGQGGVEVQYSPHGWPGADKLTRPRDIVFSRPGHWVYPNQRELRANPEAAP